MPAKRDSLKASRGHTEARTRIHLQRAPFSRFDAEWTHVWAREAAFAASRRASLLQQEKSNIIALIVSSYKRQTVVYCLEMERAIAYLRVSTQRQQRSGLGIEAQRATIIRFAEAEGFSIIREFIETETGKGADALDRRPQLASALAAAKIAKCSVVVSKLDRLSRDVAFVSGLMAQRVPSSSPNWAATRSLHAAPLCRAGRKRTATDLRAHQGRACSQEGSRRHAR